MFNNAKVKAVRHSDDMAGPNDNRNKFQSATNKVQRSKHKQNGDNATIE